MQLAGPFAGRFRPSGRDGKGQKEDVSGQGNGMTTFVRAGIYHHEEMNGSGKCQLRGLFLSDKERTKTDNAAKVSVSKWGV